MLHIMYRLIWTFIYFIFSFLCFVKFMAISLHKKCIKYFINISAEEELQLIVNAVKRMDKAPSHIVFVLGSDNISFKDLGNIIIWCIAAGVSFLSFYDFEGKLKEEEDHFRNIVMKTHKKYSGNIIWGEKQTISEGHYQNGIKNGTDFLRKVKVNVFAQEDGKGSIVGVALELCQSVKENKLKVADINREVIDRMICFHSAVPDPDVAVLCDSLCCPNGLLPWQIRVTEFVQVHTHHNISVTDFVSILSKYSKCEQRFGK